MHNSQRKNLLYFLRTRVDDGGHFLAGLARHESDDGEDGEPGVDGRAEADDVDHDRVPASARRMMECLKCEEMP